MLALGLAEGSGAGSGRERAWSTRSATAIASQGSSRRSTRIPKTSLPRRAGRSAGRSTPVMARATADERLVPLRVAPLLPVRKPVEPHREHGHEAAPALQPTQRPLHALHEESLVGEVGERVVKGGEGRALLGLRWQPRLQGQGREIGDHLREHRILGRERAGCVAHVLEADHAHEPAGHPNRGGEHGGDAVTSEVGGEQIASYGIAGRLVGIDGSSLRQDIEAPRVGEDRELLASGLYVPALVAQVEVLATEGTAVGVEAPEGNPACLHDAGRGFEHEGEIRPAPGRGGSPGAPREVNERAEAIAEA